MKPIKNYEEVKPSTGDFARPAAGGYICKIVDVEDIPLDAKTKKGDYLKIEYDIADGEFKGYYKDAYDRTGDWWARFIRSYKEKALGMFKTFTNAVEASNKGYEWDWNEAGLRGKYIGLVIGEEEYLGSDGEVKTRLYVQNVKSIEDIKNGNFKIPALKKYKGEAAPRENMPELPEEFGASLNDDDLPFN